MIVQEAFKDINKNYHDFSFKLIYSRRFNDFNANIKKRGSNIEFSLSDSWRDIGDEIKIGLIQHLLFRMFKIKKNTIYTDLYDDFIKKLDRFSPIKHTNNISEESFNRVNEKYFNGLMEIPNLKFGQNSTTQLGLYNFQSNTVTISNILREEDQEVLDYVMYHELLHKREKFHNTNGRNFYHTAKFKKEEKKFENYHQMENKLKSIIRKHKSPKKVTRKRKSNISRLFDFFG
ncbi:SprT-like domain-containing protein [Candidatus Woesearchaeota archaeon]|nr:SprT-like domain-containing protein [Candidatus Woesearchaeota archaeon]